MEEKFRKIQERTVILFAVLFLAISFYLTALLSGRSNYVLKQTASNLIAASNRQMELNIDSYLTKVEKAASLLFAEDDFYDYDPSDESLDPYVKSQTEEAMEDRINDLGILDNYTDFSVVYSNDDIVGWVSKSTRALYTDGGMYADFENILKTDGTDRSWVFGLGGNTDHLYYLQRYNDHGIIMVSFYSNELSDYFQIPEQLDGMTVALADEENNILYASSSSLIGEKISAETQEILGSVTDGSVMTKDVLVTSNTCTNGWHIICTIPSESVIKDNRTASRQSLWLVLAAVALILLFGLRRTKAMNLSAAGIVEKLQADADHDRMTGLLNKVEFQQASDRELAQRSPRKTYCFTIIDLDHFKEINDTCGHEAGDTLIVAFAEILTEIFGAEYLLGRIGGDEFGVFASLGETASGDALQEIQDRLHQVRQKMDEKDFAKNYKELKPSFSSGTVRAKADDTSFDSLYRRADALLYRSKNSGRSRDEGSAKSL